MKSLNEEMNEKLQVIECNTYMHVTPQKANLITVITQMTASLYLVAIRVHWKQTLHCVQSESLIISFLNFSFIYETTYNNTPLKKLDSV